MTEYDKWEQVGTTFDGKKGCLSCKNYLKFDIYSEDGTRTGSNYCIILADPTRRPEECPELEKGK
jgi:hypothetical protein